MSEESDEEYLFLLLLLSFKDFLRLPLTSSSELSSDDEIFPDFLFFPEIKYYCISIHYAIYNMYWPDILTSYIYPWITFLFLYCTRDFTSLNVTTVYNFYRLQRFSTSCSSLLNFLNYIYSLCNLSKNNMFPIKKIKVKRSRWV